MKLPVLTISLMLMSFAVFAQEEGQLKKKIPVNSNQPNNRNGANANTRKETDKKDSTLGFEHRDDLKDSINISYRYLDSLRRNTIDSSINDFDRYFSLPSNWQYLGNNGAAAFPLIFQPNMKPGWDAGFHAFDIYRFTLEGSKFYKSTRPFSSLSYQLASGKEQMLKAMHTQNPKPNLNVGFDYRLISAPGFFVTQNTNHNNVRLFSNYQGKRKRYNAYFLLVSNTIRASENGGIQNDSFLLDPNRKDRFSVPVKLGGSAEFRTNPFATTINTGNTYKDFNFFFRQSYDLGKRDSVAINDSTTEFLFYPKLRLQYTLNTASYTYTFNDVLTDSAIYNDWYDLLFNKKIDSFSRREKWKLVNHDFSIIQFPDTKNQAQFLSAGATLQQIKGELRTGNISNYNVILHGEYRNRTRNKRWDLLLKGEFYPTGFNSGDYSVQASLGRFLNKKLGDVNLFFQNVNRTPSFVFDNRSSFNLGDFQDFKKENITLFGATATNAFFTLGFKNYLVTNYTYFSDYYHKAQYSKLINLLQVSASKKIKISRRWNWYTEATVQQTDAAAPIKVPLLFTRNRLAFEGRFFKNLNLSTGVEVRYYTAYKANNYSPVIGQFFPQDTITIKNLPDVSVFLHFRIKSFTGFIRSENLNTASFKNGFGFVNNNFAAPHYPTQGMMIRFGIQWWFVN
ncbi:MAG TPA: hypothetical protein PLC48_11200 [Ferruginibacter sp.]|nr:hypothetical protein [Ferruginibacter sp.]